MIFDVAIVGGGPTGGWLARELAKNNISVVLFERSSTAGEPNFSSAGSPLYTLDHFCIPKEAVATYWDSIFITGPQNSKEWRFDKQAGLVFDFRKLKMLLLDEAKAAGAKIILGITVEAVEHRKEYTLVRTRPAGDYAAKIIVDASGPAGVIASQVGLRKTQLSLPSSAIEIIAEVEPSSERHYRALSFYVGNRWVPHGYGWIFPMVKPWVKIGVGIYQPLRYSPPPNLDNVLTQFIKQLPGIKIIKILEKHGGMAYLTGGLKNHVSGNVLAIGDAADQINPLAGEGIRHALQSAAFAKEVIVDSLKTGDIKRLSRYNNLWKQYVGRRWKLSALASKYTYTYFTDAWWNRGLRLISKLAPEELFGVVFEYRAGPVIRALLR